MLGWGSGINSSLKLFTVSLQYRILPNNWKRDFKDILQSASFALGKRNITKAFRTLPYKFQGLGLPDPIVEIFALKLHLIQNHWGTGSEVGKFLQQAYETFRAEIGIAGNIFKVKFEKFHALASDGWFKHLWELCNIFDSDLIFRDRYEVPMTRQDDKSIMDEIITLTWYNLPELASINRVRKFKQVYCLGDITLTDGRTIQLSMFNRTKGSSTRTFPIEKPIAKDFKIWNAALKGISDHHLRLPFTLGPFITEPHIDKNWSANEDVTEVCHQMSAGHFQSYPLSGAPRATRFGK